MEAKEKDKKKAAVKIAALCLAGGQGKRMQSAIQKQYLPLGDKPVLFYALNSLQNSRVEQIVLIVGEGEEEYCREEIVQKYGFSKVSSIVCGGRERYHSVYQGLLALEDCEYVLIHDGARPFLTNEIIERCIEGATEYGACVVGMPVKDTIKLADSEGKIDCTPDRSRVWMIQTPQAFRFSLIKEGYEGLMLLQKHGKTLETAVTDDAMVVEYFFDQKVHLVEGSYENIKLTTPEDMEIAEVFLKRREGLHGL